MGQPEKSLIRKGSESWEVIIGVPIKTTQKLKLRTSLPQQYFIKGLLSP